MQAQPFLPESLPPLNGIVRNDLRSRAAYAEGAGIFRIIPAGVVVPSTSAALTRLVSWAAATGTPLIPRGAGSGMAGGNLGPEVVVDLTVLNGAPLQVDPAAGRARAGAAVTLRALGELAGRHGLRLPPDPSSARFATLGGLISTNASGPRSVRSGSVRRWVESVDFLTADGYSMTLRRGAANPDTPAVLRFRAEAEPALVRARGAIEQRFPRTLKSSSGYALDRWLESGDLLDLVIGAEGTLGFVIGAEWRLEPVPAHYGGVRAALRDAGGLGDIVLQLRALGPAALEFLDRTFLDFARVPHGGSDGFLMLELEAGTAAEIEDGIAGARGILAPHALELLEAKDRHTLADLWAVRHAASPMLATLGDTRRSLQVIEDACVPVESLSRYIAAVRDAGARHRIELVVFGHAGEGNLHVNLLPDLAEPDWSGRVAALFEEISEAVVAMGGSLSGEHGDGRLRGPLLERVFGSEIVALFRLVKEAFDPQGIMNPGVKLPGPEAPRLGTLKVGPAAMPLPDDIERGLRLIERHGGYALSRLDLAGL
jgi:FAD/FMN-containing dehydrogenase